MTNHVGISEDQLANRSECTMTKRIFSRAAKFADLLLSATYDHLSGNKSRRIALHRLAQEIADDIRRKRWARKHDKAHQLLSRPPKLHQQMLLRRAMYYRYLQLF